MSYIIGGLLGGVFALFCYGLGFIHGSIASEDEEDRCFVDECEHIDSLIELEERVRALESQAIAKGKRVGKK